MQIRPLTHGTKQTAAINRRALHNPKDGSSLTSRRKLFRLTELSLACCLFFHQPRSDLSQKAWGGVFSEATDRRVEQFTESVSFDRRLFVQDIAGSTAHAQ